MTLLCKLVTLPGQLVSGSADAYYVSQDSGEYVLHNHGLAPRRFATLPQLAHTLGGVVAWDRWSPEAQLQLDQLGLRGAS